MLTEPEVRELCGSAVDSDEFPRPIQHGPEGRKWDVETVEAWVHTKRRASRKRLYAGPRMKVNRSRPGQWSRQR